MRIYLLLLVGFFCMPHLEVSAQVCNCTEYVYLNDLLSSITNGEVHKYSVNGNGSLVEINPGGPWYPNGGASELPSPHGIGTDLNGFLYIAESFTDTNAGIRQLTCDGVMTSSADYFIPAQGANIQTIDNTLFINQTFNATIDAYDLCTTNSVGSFCFEDEFGGEVWADWGFGKADDGTLYAIGESGN